MRIRSIRPEFWSSEDVASMDWNTRLVYVGLWSYVDDNGVGRDIEKLIVAALFPLDSVGESSRRVTGALRHLSEHGQIVRYTVGGKRFLHIVRWSTHQRVEKASKGRYPAPTCEDATLPEHSPTTPGTLPEMSALGEGEKGRRGEEEKSPSPRAVEAAWETFWDFYPRKVGKIAAHAAFLKAAKTIDPELLVNGIARMANDPNLPIERLIPHAKTWLNEGRWEDGPYPPQTSLSNQGAFYAREAARLAAKEPATVTNLHQIGAGA